MKQERITLGIDVSKQKFDVALYRFGKFKHKKFTNKDKGFDALFAWLSRHQAEHAHVCMEATGIYHEGLAQWLHDKGWVVSVVNPSRVKGFAQSELVRSKTDKVDAGVLARFCLALRPAPWVPMPIENRQLRDWARRLESLIDMRQQEHNRLEAAAPTVASTIETHITYLSDQIKSVKARIDDHIDQHPKLRSQKQLLETIPGVGPATIRLVLSEFADVTDYRNAKALAAFMGVAPRVIQSGSSVRGRSRMSRMGRSTLRKAFFLPAMVALKYNPILQSMKKRLTAAGKPKMLIIGAAMRKLIHIIYGVLKSKQPFQANWA